MIYFFTATGNDKYVAERIAESSGDATKSMTECTWESDYECDLQKGENLGIVVPTYFWGLPSVVSDFLSKLRVSGKPAYTFIVATYGTTCGAVGRYAEKLLAENGISTDALFSVKMPDTWTVMFDLSDKAAVAEKNAAADVQIAKVARSVAERLHSKRMPGSVPAFLAWFAQRLYQGARKTNHLNAGGKCIGCGLCARQCPVRAITMEDKHPKWVKERCAMCLGCLHRCPVFAIQYSDKTEAHGQYTHPGVKLPT